MRGTEKGKRKVKVDMSGTGLKSTKTKERERREGRKGRKGRHCICL